MVSTHLQYALQPPAGVALSRFRTRHLEKRKISTRCPIKGMRPRDSLRRAVLVPVPLGLPSLTGPGNKAPGLQRRGGPAEPRGEALLRGRKVEVLLSSSHRGRSRAGSGRVRGGGIWRILEKSSPPLPSASQKKILEDRLVYASGSRPCGVDKQSGVPLTVCACPLGHVGDVRQLPPLGQGGGHALQLGADGGVVALALSGQLVEGGVLQGAIWRGRGRRAPSGRGDRRRRDPVWHRARRRNEVGAQRDLGVGSSVVARHRPAGLSGGVAGDGRRLFLRRRICGNTSGGGAAGQDVVFDVAVGQRVGLRAVRSRGSARGQGGCVWGLAAGRAGQSGGTRGDRVFQQDVFVDGAVPRARGPSGAHGQRLGVEDAELLVKLLRYLTGKLDEVAGV
ncbi:hypothetical protein EYF80_022427 [Liparis tanakae]|uniref:Uncharacterized protein n=1 Tax=Liparis tanakae TaxID=230148 RepID=A0A4Z2HP11_9TELE|nr:hypothetical protein EYF80_022427 [Liparis tanakae]